MKTKNPGRSPIALLGGCYFETMVRLKRIEIVGYDRAKLDPDGKGMVVICNHASMLEAAYLPFLTFPWYVMDDRRFLYSLPDKDNIYDKKWFVPLRKFCIPMSRQNNRVVPGTIKELRDFLEVKHGSTGLFPEAGRTFKAKRARGRGAKTSKYGNEIAAFPKAVRRLFVGATFKVVPVWFEGGEKVIPNKYELGKTLFTPWRIWRKVHIYIGEPFYVTDLGKNEVVGRLEDSLLELADRYVKRK